MEQPSSTDIGIMPLLRIKEGIEKACEANDLETVKRLFVQGGYHTRGFSLDLVWALSRAIEKRHLDIVTYLYTNGAYLDQRVIINFIKEEDYKMLEMFRTLGWDLNENMGAYDPSALPFALGNPRMMHWMLDRGVDPNPRCAFNCTPMSFAICSAPPSVIGVLFAAGGNMTAGLLFARWSIEALISTSKLTTSTRGHTRTASWTAPRFTVPLSVVTLA
ncbi:hypothetical protein DV735_g1017, partial [Chaetothyriales sp. CBS 134920]